MPKTKKFRAIFSVEVDFEMPLQGYEDEDQDVEADDMANDIQYLIGARYDGDVSVATENVIELTPNPRRSRVTKKEKGRGK